MTYSLKTRKDASKKPVGPAVMDLGELMSEIKNAMHEATTYEGRTG